MLDCLIIADGIVPDAELLSKWWPTFDLKIACDGAGNILLSESYKFRPDVIIGDMDSFDSNCMPDEDHDVEIIPQRDQNTNDLEKALTLAKTKNCSEVTIVGGLGKRIDHTLKNISVLLQFNEVFERIGFEDEYGISFILPKEWRANLPIGTVLSLSPVDGEVTQISSQGLAYSLNNDSLLMGFRDGSSNHTISQTVSITHGHGALLCFIGTRLPLKKLKKR